MASDFVRGLATCFIVGFAYFVGIIALIILSWLLSNWIISKHDKDIAEQKQLEPVDHFLYDSYGQKKEIDERIRVQAREIRNKIRGV